MVSRSWLPASFKNSADRMPDAFMAKTREMSMLPRPSPRDYKSLIYWFESQKPLLMAEMLWIRRKEDIVTLRTGRVGAFFDELVERLLGVIDRFLTRWCGCTVINVSDVQIGPIPLIRSDAFAAHLQHARAARKDHRQVRAILLARSY